VVWHRLASSSMSVGQPRLSNVLAPCNMAPYYAGRFGHFKWTM